MAVLPANQRAMEREFAAAGLLLARMGVVREGEGIEVHGSVA